MTLAQEFEKLLTRGGSLTFGELQLSHSEDGSYSACHRSDATMLEDLESLGSTAAIREMARFDDDGTYRPLKTAPTLKRGWRISSPHADEFLRFLDAIYPGVVATWVAYNRREIEAVPLRDTLKRQTGMYSIASAITDQMANQIMRDTCSFGCIRTIAWPIDDRCPVSLLKRHPKEIPVICTEACTFALNEARRMAKEAQASTD